MTKRRTFQVTLTGVLPKGMTVAQARYAVWNQNLDLDIDLSDFADVTNRDTMKMKLGRATLTNR